MDLHSDQDQSNRINELIHTLKLAKHPEGGFYSETYRSTQTTANKKGVLMTSIYFLLTSENVSNFHRISNDELWFHHEGSPIVIHTLEDKVHKEYILGNLAKASEILAQANELTTQYEQELSNVRKEAQLEITNSQKIHKEILEIELNISQKYIDNLLDTITKDLLDKKNTALNSLDTIVQSLCVEIETRLSI